MIVRKLFWLATEISLAALWVCFGSGAALALALAMLLIPLVSIPINLYLRRKIRLKLTAQPNLRKEQEAQIMLKLTNPTVLPVNLSCCLAVTNLLNGMLLREKVHVTGNQVTRSVKSRYCGRLRITVEKAKLYDCFGLVGIPLSCPEKCHITVQPDGFETRISLADELGGIAESEQYSQYRSGSDMTETFQLREYVPGDSPGRSTGSSAASWTGLSSGTPVCRSFRMCSCSGNARNRRKLSNPLMPRRRSLSASQGHCWNRMYSSGWAGTIRRKTAVFSMRSGSWMT